MQLALGILLLWVACVAIFVAIQGFRNLQSEQAGQYQGAWDFIAQRIYQPINAQIIAADQAAAT